MNHIDVGRSNEFSDVTQRLLMAVIACDSPCATVLLTEVQVPLQCMGICFPDWQTDGWRAEDATIRNAA